MDNLADSVVSVAETFIHEELSAREEAALRESFHPDLDRSELSESEDIVPGGLDPFISEDEVHQHDAEPPGVSIFATLIERLLARFQFDATDTRITIVNPQESSFTLIVPDIRYSTESQATSSTIPEGDTRVPDEKATAGEVRKVMITGATVTSRCLRPPTLQPITALPTSSSRTASVHAVSPKSTTPTTPIDQSVIAHDEGNSPDSHAHTPDVLQSSGSPPPAEPSSPYHSDSSDMDEETQMFMSQSIAVLPPRPISPASSVGSSMYQSAISTSAPDTGLDNIPEEVPPSRDSTPSPPRRMEPLEDDGSRSPVQTPSLPVDSPMSSRSPVVSPFQRRLEIRTGEIEDETVLSLGSEPIEIRLTTPSPRGSSTTQSASSAASPNVQQESRTASRENPDGSAPRQDRMRVDLTIGTIACALSARQIRSILDIAEAWSSHSPVPSRPQEPTSPGEAGPPSPLDDLEGALRVRGIVILLLSSSRTSASNPDDALTEFFSRPLVPPRLPSGYVRVHIEGISSSLSIRPGEVAKSKRASYGREAPSMSMSSTITDIAAFTFLPPPGPGVDMLASPILITDPHLPSQYTLGHIHPSLDTSSEPSGSLPSFDITDWTEPTQQSLGAKLSMWRTKLAASTRPSSQSARRDAEPSVSTSPPSVRPFPVVLPSSPGRLGLAGLSSSPGKAHQTAPKPVPPALAVKFRPASKDHRETADIQVSLAPLHIFLDVGAILGPTQDGKSEALRFLEEIADSHGAQQAQEAGTEPMEYDEDTEEEGSRPTTPRVSGLRGFREEDAERERRRLEQLVLDDLDLGYDYRKPAAQPQTTPRSRRSKVSHGRRWVANLADSLTSQKPQAKASATTVSVNLPAVRVEIRVPPPAKRKPRSGAVILDIHDLCLTPGRAPERGGDRTARFGTAEDLFGAEPASRAPTQDNNLLLGATWKRIVAAHSLVGGSKARAILSLGPLTAQDSGQGSYFGVGTPPAREAPGSSLQPQVLVSRAAVAPHAAESVSSMAISLDIPSVHVELSKPLLDGLQLWADDLTQLMEAAFAEHTGSDTGTQRAGSGDSSMIGSRFFARTETSSSAPDSGVTSLAGTIRARQEPRSETAVKVMVTEGEIIA